MKFWKIGLSVIIALLAFFSIMNTITGNFNINENITALTPSIFYTGVIIVVLSNIMICAVILACTSNIIKAINNKNM